jgi:hypothetical protein
MTAAAYDIATEHAILVEASTAGKWSAVPEAVLFGILLGLLYDLFAVAAMFMGLRCVDGADGKLISRLRQCRRRSVRGKPALEQPHDAGHVHRIPTAVLQCILDILYFFICGILGAVFLYWRNEGIFRWYLMLCGVLGYWAYRHTAGVVVMRGAAFILSCTRALLCTLFNYTLYYPLRWGWLALTAIAVRCRKLGIRFCRRKTKETKQRKRIGALWQNNRNSQRKNPVSSRRSRSSSLSASAPSRFFSFTGRSLNTKKKLR